ncbi:MAG: YraN family protein [Clostridia bacterium]|nr:YraN family protein [Clostridia bacterium]
MRNNIKIGKYGEDVAIRYLLKNNYKILERNFRCKQGEIDIIANDKNEMVFIEVKTRSNLNYGTPAQAVDYNKMNHIYKSANVYLKLKKVKDIIVRFDIIEVYIQNNMCKVVQLKQVV